MPISAGSCQDGISGLVWELLPAGSQPGSSSSCVPLVSVGGEARQPLVRAALGWWSSCITELAPVGDRQEFPGSSPGIPPPWGRGSFGSAPGQGVPRGWRAPLSDSRGSLGSHVPCWAPSGLSWGCAKGGAQRWRGCRDWKWPLKGWLPLPGALAVGALGLQAPSAAGTAKHQEWRGCCWRFQAWILVWAKGHLPRSLNLCNTSFSSTSNKNSSF